MVSNNFDQTSIGMAMATVMLQAMSEATKSDLMFFITAGVGITAIALNIKKFFYKKND